MSKPKRKLSKSGYPYLPARLVPVKNKNGVADISTRWYVVFYVYNQDTGKLEKKRNYDVNKYQSVTERKNAAKIIIAEINDLLYNDYSLKPSEPDPEPEPIKEKQAPTGPFHPSTHTLLDGFAYFQELSYSSIKEGTQKGYTSLFKSLYEWLDKKEMLHLGFLEFNIQKANEFFDYLKLEKKVKFKKEERKGVSNKTFNNYLGYFITFYNFFIRRGMLLATQNPLEFFSKKNTETNQHTPFTNKQIQLIKAKMMEKKAYQLLTFVQFLYYTFGRPGKEVRLLQVKDIRAKTIFFPSSRAKNATGAHVAIPPELELIIQENNYREFPPNYYIFTLSGKPGPEPVGINYFTRNHLKILKAVGINQPEYDLYGYKHTGNINLYNATKDLKAVQRQNRHKTSAQTDTYLRALGLLMDEDPIINFPKFGGEDPENKKANDS